MRNILKLAVIVLLTSTVLNAQERNEKRTQLNSAQKLTLHVKKMTLHLDLDENQQKAIYELKNKQVDERQKTREEFKQNRAQRSSDTHFEMKNNFLDRQIEHKTAMKKILTEDQFTKWENANINNKKRGERHLKKSKKMNRNNTPRNFKRTEHPKRQFKK